MCINLLNRVVKGVRARTISRCFSRCSFRFGVEGDPISDLYLTVEDSDPILEDDDIFQPLDTPEAIIENLLKDKVAAEP